MHLNNLNNYQGSLGDQNGWGNHLKLKSIQVGHDSSEFSKLIDLVLLADNKNVEIWPIIGTFWCDMKCILKYFQVNIKYFIPLV